MRLTKSLLTAASIALAFQAVCWGQVPDAIAKSAALSEARPRLRMAILTNEQGHPPGKIDCRDLILLPPNNENREYWQFINNAMFARAAEIQDTVTHTNLLESLPLLIINLRNWITTQPKSGKSPTNRLRSLLSAVTGVSFNGNESEERLDLSIDIHLLCIDFFAQAYAVRSASPRNEDGQAAKEQMEQLLDAALDIEEIAFTITDRFLAPLLDRMIHQLALEFFKTGNHRFGIEIRKASSVSLEEVENLIESRIQRTVPVIRSQLLSDRSERSDLLLSALNLTYFFNTVGAALVTRDLAKGELALIAWVDEIARAIALTQSRFLAGYFRLSRINLQGDLERLPSELAGTTAVTLEQAARRLTAEPPHRWAEARQRLAKSPALGMHIGLVVNDILPILEVGAMDDFNINTLKNSLLAQLGSEEDTSR